MKILKLPAYYDPEQVASSHLTSDVNEAFINEGYIIENYVPIPSRGISEEVREQYKTKIYEEECDGHIIIHRFPVFPEKKSTIQRTLRYIFVNVKQYYRGSKAKDIDLIYAGSTPPTQGILCSKVKKKLSKRYGRSIPFIYVLQDIFPDSLVNANMIKKGSFIWKIGRKMEDYTYRNADKIIVIIDDYKKNIMAKGVPDDKIIVIPNWVNTDNVVPVERMDNLLIDRYQINPNSFIVCYSGNIGHSQNLTLLIELAKRVKDTYPDILFVIIGEGAQKEELISLKEKHALSNVLILPFQDYSEIAHVFSLGDAGLLISKSGVGLSSVPSKTWGIMSASRPVLASIDKQSYASDLIDRIGCGVACGADDINALEKGLIELYENRNRRKEMGAKGRDYVTKELNKDIATKKYVDVIKSVIEK